MTKEAAVNDIGEAFAKAGKQLASEALARGEKLAKALEGISLEVAADIRDYSLHIAEALLGRLNGDWKPLDAEIAIKNWKQSTKSALKKLKVTTEWELHDSFWGFVDFLFKKILPILKEAI